MKKKSVCLLMFIPLVIFSCVTLAHENNGNVSRQIEVDFEVNEYSESFVKKELKQNTERMRQLFGSKGNERVDEKSSVEIIIQKDLTKVLMSIEYLGSRQKTELYGTCECVQTDEVTGYVGVYEGFISPIEGRNLSTNEDGLIPVIVDAVFTPKEIAVVITLGYADEKHDPDILFYGQSSNILDAISSEDARRTIEAKTFRDERSV